MNSSICGGDRAPSKRTYGASYRRQAGFSKIGLLIIGAVIGAALIISIPVGVNATGTNEFCTSCHEMKIPEKEYLTSAHAVNSTGVVAECHDCHIPHSYPRKLFLKAKAGILDAYGHLTGKIDTPEKYEAHRKEMAQSEWARMKANDSAECRNCHKIVFDEKSLAKQKKSGARDHRKGIEEGKTCIDCHTGLVHEEPEGEEEEEGEGEEEGESEEEEDSGGEAADE
jgi:nitrate/TMAO reductase-like tetraheme cytochrome c subunit